MHERVSNWEFRSTASIRLVDWKWSLELPNLNCKWILEEFRVSAREVKPQLYFLDECLTSVYSAGVGLWAFWGPVLRGGGAEPSLMGNSPPHPCNSSASHQGGLAGPLQGPPSLCSFPCEIIVHMSLASWFGQQIGIMLPSFMTQGDLEPVIVPDTLTLCVKSENVWSPGRIFTVLFQIYKNNTYMHVIQATQKEGMLGRVSHKK